PVSATVVQLACRDQSGNPVVCPDDAKIATYSSLTATTNLGPIILSGTLHGCGVGTQVVGKIKPSTSTGTVVLHRWILDREGYAGSTPTSSKKYADDTSDPAYRHDDPQSCSN